MVNRFRRFLESVAYAGLKPRTPAQESAQPDAAKPEAAQTEGWRKQLRDRFEKWVNGEAPADPLYLSRRTWQQRARLAAAVAVPCLLLAGAVALALSNLYTPQTGPPPEPTAAEIIARLPDINKTLEQIKVTREAEVLESKVVKGNPPQLTGSIKNLTANPLSVSVVFDFTDQIGSRVGAAEYKIENIPANGTLPFQFPVASTHATFALVRQIKSEK
jgi:hypothetical protein